MPFYAAESERLWLQTLSVEDHLQDYFEIMSAPAAMYWSTGHVHKDPQETLALMLKSLPSPAQPWNERWAIMLRPEAQSAAPAAGSGPGDAESAAAVAKPKMIGILGTPRKGDLAYKMNPDYWGKGYMSEALQMFLKMWWGMKGNAGFARLTAGADPRNGASTRILEKGGFQKTEGGFKPGFYERAVDAGVKGDMQMFHLDRPSA